MALWQLMHLGTWCMSCHKVIVVITGRAHCFHDLIYIMLILFLWDLSTLYVIDHLWPLILYIIYITYIIYIYLYIYIYIIYIYIIYIIYIHILYIYIYKHTFSIYKSKSHKTHLRVSLTLGLYVMDFICFEVFSSMFLYVLFV